MANPQHVEWLLEGVEAWNARREREDFVPDLQNADLSGLDLSGMNLAHANLQRADLSSANLSGATLDHSNLERANLSDALFHRSFLQGAIIRNSLVRAALILHSNLWETDFGSSDLRNVDFRQSVFRNTNFDGTLMDGVDVRSTQIDPPPFLFFDDVKRRHTLVMNLKGAIGLTQRQLDTMLVDTGTLLPGGLHHPKHWPYPEVTQPESIDPSGESVAPFIFLSYSSRDREEVRKFLQFFTDQGINAWWDQDIPAGGAWRQTLAARLEAAKAILTFWTAESTQSPAVIEEASTAQSSRKLLHARLDGSRLPYGFGETWHVDLEGWDGTATHPGMAKLLQAMRDKLDPPATATLKTRLSSASPIAFEPNDGKLTAVDTPPHVPPLQMNPEDLKARLEGLFQSAKVIATSIAEDRYNVPRDLGFCLEAFEALRSIVPINWYSLDDRRQSMLDCIDVNDGRDFWPEILVRQLDRLSSRVDEIEPLIRPRQPAPNEPGAKPPLPDPDLAGKDETEIEEIASEASEALEAPEIDEVLAPTAHDALARAVSDLASAIKMRSLSPEAKDRRSSRIRRALRRLGMVSAALGVVATGVTVNVLTSADAATVLVARFQAILEKILPYFF